MKPWIKTALSICLLASAVLTRGHGVTEEMATAARNFLSALPEEKKAKASFQMDNDERFNFHFIPRTRKGLPLKEMSGDERALAHALLSTGLSHRGYFKAATIMSLEQILREIEQGKGPVRDPEQYFFSVFGTPEDHGKWAWRVEGHHLSLNFTVSGDEVSATPSFFGTNPGEVRAGQRKGVRVLSREEDLARELVTSLSEDQRKTAIYDAKAPADIITAADRKARVLDPKGIALGALNDKQKQNLFALIEEYIFRARPEVASKEMAEIKAASPSEIHFAWAGSIEPKQPHYYRVQGPGFLLEYDNTQNNANHVHAVWRDLKNDFGDDILRRHYDESHSK